VFVRRIEVIVIVIIIIPIPGRDRVVFVVKLTPAVLVFVPANFKFRKKILTWKHVCFTGNYKSS